MGWGSNFYLLVFLHRHDHDEMPSDIPRNLGKSLLKTHADEVITCRKSVCLHVSSYNFCSRHAIPLKLRRIAAQIRSYPKTYQSVSWVGCACVHTSLNLNFFSKTAPKSGFLRTGTRSVFWFSEKTNSNLKTSVKSARADPDLSTVAMKSLEYVLVVFEAVLCVSKSNT